MNPDAITGYAQKNIIANPNCSTAQMVVALKPLHDRAGIRRVVVSTYQSVSGAGKAGMDELWDHTRAKFTVNDDIESSVFTKDIAFNVVPHIGQFLEDGSTQEEWKMVAETKKIVDPSIKGYGYLCPGSGLCRSLTEAINIEFEEFLDEEEARSILRESPGVLVIDKRERRGIRDSHRLCRRLCDVRQPNPPGPHSRQWARPVVRFRQSPQGCSAQWPCRSRNCSGVES